MNEILQDTRKRKQLIFTYFTFMLNGMLALSIGSLMPFIRDARGLDYVFAGLMVSIHSVGNLISSFFAGSAAVALGRRKSILMFNACYFLAYCLIIFGENKYLLLLAFLFTGLARGASSNFNNTSINNLAPGNAFFMNCLHAMFSIGAFLFPILLIAMTSANPDNWIFAVWFMLIMGILSWISYFIVPVDEFTGKKETKKTDNNWGFFREPLFYFCFLTLFFYLCVEQGVMGWLVTYFKDSNLLSASLAQVMASVQWIMVLAGRLTVAFLSTKMEKTKLLRLMGASTLIFFVVLITARNPIQIVIGIIGFGFSMAGIYPTTVSFSGNIIQKYPMAWSFLLTFASLGSIIMPSVIGRVAEAAGILTGMSTIVVVIVLDMILILTLTSYIRKQTAK